MALFSKKKTSSADTEQTKESKTSKVVANAAKSVGSNPSIRSKRPVLKGLRITEKSVIQNEDGNYVLNVDPRATKPEIKEALKRIYGVDATDVRVVNHPGKVKRRGQKFGRTARSKKAYVQLSKGQSIELA